MKESQKNLFKTETFAKEGSGKLFEERLVANEGPVVCLGKTFEDDNARRTYFTEELRKS